MYKKIFSIAVLSAFSTGAFAQDTSVPKFNQDFKVSAKIDAGCFLTADNINFGNLVTPITNQSANGTIKVHCSKGAPLSIKINYGINSNLSSEGVYTATTLSNVYNSNSLTTYRISKNGSYISTPISGFNFDIFCETNRVAFFSPEVLSLYKTGEVPLNSWRTDVWGVCSGTKINQTTLANLSGEVGGILNGLMHGEQIKYSLEVPNQSTTIWNTSSGYSFTGTGIEQTIPMKANIKSNGNPTHRMTPDTYSSTLTVLLDY